MGAISPVGWALLGVLAVFVLYLLLKTFGALRAVRGAPVEVRKAIQAAKQSARSASTAEEKAAAWRAAGDLAFDDLGRPSLAASYALRAIRADRDDVLALDLLSQALRQAGRYKALERFMWRRLSKPAGPGFERAYDELVELYEGPLKKRAGARALRALRGRVSSPAPAK